MRQLSLFKGKRQRGPSPPPPLEFESHCFLADVIRRWIMPQWRFTHLPFGEHRNKATAARLQRMGVNAGWPDFIFVGPGQRVFWLELKRRGRGRIHDDQAVVLGHLVACGFSLLVTTSVDDAIAELKARGILRSTFEVQ
ncbi:hypothetical protein ABIG06_006278 [Bradyrhizobium sp. USDA 326]|uniref:hypothetical protein n=1 Tax=unclassified Bradyrhizobium TaxID=2631580 RepID=UPI00351808E7